MNKSELVEAVAGATGSSKSAASDAVDAVFDTITSTLQKGEKVQITGFGTFERRFRKASTARNPQTGAEVAVPARNVPAFKAGKGLKDAVR